MKALKLFLAVACSLYLIAPGFSGDQPHQSEEDLRIALSGSSQGSAGSILERAREILSGTAGLDASMAPLVGVGLDVSQVTLTFDAKGCKVVVLQSDLEEILASGEAQALQHRYCRASQSLVKTWGNALGGGVFHVVNAAYRQSAQYAKRRGYPAAAAAKALCWLAEKSGPKATSCVNSATNRMKADYRLGKRYSTLARKNAGRERLNIETFEKDEAILAERARKTEIDDFFVKLCDLYPRDEVEEADAALEAACLLGAELVRVDKANLEKALGELQALFYN